MRDFTGFRFGNVHSEDLHLVVVSSSNRYDKNLLPEPTDYSVDVPGGDGKYYFGQTFKTREFVVNVAFDSVSESIFRKIAQLFATDKLQDLVFNELPYKTYRAKLKSKPDFKHVCFMDRATGKRVYKGEGTLHFICYFPYAFGFNRYVVRAADYYRCMPPEHIITNSVEENPYKKRGPIKILPGIIKDHYNVRQNMNTPWKGGYPTIEQVQAGELYFTPPPSENRPLIPQDCSSVAPNNDNKLIIDVRRYWDNIPEWEDTAKLLTTPTLDYEQELIFMPQYNKVNYINMDTGLNNGQGLIGSRMLIYNPGDIPIEFELKMDNVRKRFRADEGDYSFRVNRYNVQRLSIEDAVDWTGLTTHHIADNEPYKYSNRYFKILEQGAEHTNGANPPVPLGYYDVEYRLLKNAHPNHCYIVEPIPREKLAHYIRLFYWQSYQLGLMTEEEWRGGVDMANRYQEMYDECIYDEERYELYWQTLKDAIIIKYQQQLEKEGATEDEIEAFEYNYFHNPPEYIRMNKDWEKQYGHHYGEVDFNLSRLPIYITEDYIQLNSDELFDDDVIDPSELIKDIEQYRAQTIPHSLFLDTERRMVYNINKPEWKNCEGWLDDNINEAHNFYNYKPSKTIRNEAIEEGHWFKIPPGWSLISIEPVVDENRWGGKLWRDARPFDWGETEQAERNEFNFVYEMALRDYLKSNCPVSVIEKLDNTSVFPEWDSLTLVQMEEYAQFRRWYGDDEDFYGDFNQEPKKQPGEECTPVIKNHNLRYALIHKLNEDAEYGFLKTLCSYWNMSHMKDGKVEKGIESWWWKASNYMWANFPPLYWGYMDLLNQMNIKYVPLFY